MSEVTNYDASGFIEAADYRRAEGLASINSSLKDVTSLYDDLDDPAITEGFEGFWFYGEFSTGNLTGILIPGRIYHYTVYAGINSPGGNKTTAEGEFTLELSR